MVFSMFSKKTQPGYGVKRQVLLVLTACTCTPPPPQKKRKCREGQEQRANMAAHNDDDSNENIAKDELCPFKLYQFGTA